MTPTQKNSAGNHSPAPQNQMAGSAHIALRFFLFKTARLLFLESMLTNSLCCSDFQIASHWPPNDARVTDMWDPGLSPLCLQRFPQVHASPFAPGHQAPQRCLFRDPSQAFVYTGEHSGEPSIPVLPNPILLSGVSDGNATSPSKPSLFYHLQVTLSISLVGLTPLTPGFIFPSR